MKRITGIIMGLAVAITAIAGPGRITVTNEAGVVFRDVEVLSDNAGVLAIRTTNGVEFVKLPGRKKPPMVVTNAPHTNHIVQIPAPDKTTNIFKLRRGEVDDFDGHKKADTWYAYSQNENSYVRVFLNEFTENVKEPFWSVRIWHATKNHANAKSFKMRLDGVIYYFDKYHQICKFRTENDGRDVYSIDEISYIVPKEVFEQVKNSKAIRIRVEGELHNYDYDLPFTWKLKEGP